MCVYVYIYIYMQSSFLSVQHAASIIHFPMCQPNQTIDFPRLFLNGFSAPKKNNTKQNGQQKQEERQKKRFEPFKLFLCLKTLLQKIN